MFPVIKYGIMELEIHTLKKRSMRLTWNGYNRPTPTRGGGTLRNNPSHAG